MNDELYIFEEIKQQPKVWLKEFELIANEIDKIKSFVSNEIHLQEVEIILTGAGSSAYIGNVLIYLLPDLGYVNCKAVSTTDLLTYPESFFSIKKKIVLISFARSGNSPESIGVVQLANKLCENIVHIIITCNKTGELALKSNSANTLLLILPPETNDKSLAMTSSFTTMMLTCILVLDIHNLEKQLPQLEEVCSSATKVLNSYTYAINEIANRKFERAVFLGSGELKGIAEECHLKLQELTDGSVICKFESFLGFRHGPKAVINENTIIIYLFSQNEYVFQYEKDLVEQINTNNKVVAQIAVSQHKITIPSVNFDLEVILNNSKIENNKFNCIPYVLAGQLLGYYKSLSIGLNPDNPSVSGNISRVVEGVTLYEYQQ